MLELQVLGLPECKEAGKGRVLVSPASRKNPTVNVNVGRLTLRSAACRRCSANCSKCSGGSCDCSSCSCSTCSKNASAGCSCGASCTKCASGDCSCASCKWVLRAASTPASAGRASMILTGSLLFILCLPYYLVSTGLSSRCANCPNKSSTSKPTNCTCSGHSSTGESCKVGPLYPFMLTRSARLALIPRPFFRPVRTGLVQVRRLQQQVGVSDSRRLFSSLVSEACLAHGVVECEIETCSIGSRLMCSSYATAMI